MRAIVAAQTNNSRATGIMDHKSTTSTSTKDLIVEIYGHLVGILLVSTLGFFFWADFLRWYHLNRHGVVAIATVERLRSYSRDFDKADLKWKDSSGRSLSFRGAVFPSRTWNELEYLKRKGVDPLTLEIKHMPFPKERSYYPIPVKDLNFVKWVSIAVGGPAVALVLFLLFMIYRGLRVLVGIRYN